MRRAGGPRPRRCCPASGPRSCGRWTSWCPGVRGKTTACLELRAAGSWASAATGTSSAPAPGSQQRRRRALPGAARRTRTPLSLTARRARTCGSLCPGPAIPTTPSTSQPARQPQPGPSKAPPGPEAAATGPRKRFSFLASTSWSVALTARSAGAVPMAPA